MDRKILRKLESDLDKRVDALYDDLRLISTSEHLKVWCNRRNNRLHEVLELEKNLILSFSPLYLYPVKRYRKQVGKRKKFVYWMDVMDETSTRDKRIFQPSFALRNIKSRIKEDIEKILTDAVKHGIIPYQEERALTELDLASALRDENKIQELKNSAIVLNEPKEIILKPEFVDRYQEMWRDFINPTLHALNKVIMKKYGYEFANMLIVRPLDKKIDS